MFFYFEMLLLFSLIISHGYYAIRLFAFLKKTVRLSSITKIEKILYPNVSIVVPIHNEAGELKEAMDRLVNLDYPNLEVIAVNDRSSDASADILNECKDKSDLLQVIDIDTLPSGWLGKTHALQKGLDLANGDYILFTDADVLYHPKTLKHAMHYMMSKKIDHLTLGPYLITKSFGLRAVILYQLLNFFLFFKPWCIQDDNPQHALGLGVFNLIKKNVLDKIGGLQHVALNPIDDMGLGRVIKSYGFKQDYALAEKWLKIEWYPDLKSFYYGLEKNMFAVFEFQLLPVILSQCFLLFITFFPLYALFSSEVFLSLLGVIDITIVLLMLMTVAYYLPVNLGYALTYPFTTVIGVMICFGNVFKTLFKQGIFWGNQFFPLSQLKAFLLEKKAFLQLKVCETKRKKEVEF